MFVDISIKLILNPSCKFSNTVDKLWLKLTLECSPRHKTDEKSRQLLKFRYNR